MGLFVSIHRWDLRRLAFEQSGGVQGECRRASREGGDRGIKERGDGSCTKNVEKRGRELPREKKFRRQRRGARRGPGERGAALATRGKGERGGGKKIHRRDRDSRREVENKEKNLGPRTLKLPRKGSLGHAERKKLRRGVKGSLGEEK